MKKNRSAHTAAIVPRQWTSRISLVFLVCASLFLLVMNQANNQTVNRLRATIVDIFVPIVTVASAPLDAVANFGTWISEMSSLRAQNIALKNANLQLLQWQSAAKTLEAENKNLRSLMKVVAIPKTHYITARVVTDMSGPYVRSALVIGGTEHGIKKDQAVINEFGLVGRVVEAGNTTSRVLLLSDINSRIPVIAESSREKAILVGNNNALPSLSYVLSDSKIKVGERIVTSGDGGVFPSGIAVGIVTQVDSNSIRVQPFVDSTSVEYVNMVDYSL